MEGPEEKEGRDVAFVASWNLTLIAGVVYRHAVLETDAYWQICPTLDISFSRSLTGLQWKISVCFKYCVGTGHSV